MSEEQRPPASTGMGALSTSRGALVLPALVVVSLVAGGLVRWADPGNPWVWRVWMAVLVAAGVPVVVRTVRGLLRGNFAADVVATLSILGAVLLGQPIAGLVIVLMQTGGEWLEHYAEGRASNAVRALEEAAPRTAHRQRADGQHDDIEVSEIRAGDLLLVRPGEMLPADGVVESGRSHLDVSRLTGEAPPEMVQHGSDVRSGAVNLEGAIVLRATRPASESLYARIVELVRTAQSEKSPIQRLADQYAIWFTPLTIVVCAIAWFVTHDALRVLAVLVVATPCPLLLATPVAIIGGINRCARQQVIVRSGGALERLASVDTAVFDKTGTLTVGRPEVVAVDALDGWTEVEVLRLAAAVEVGSGHHLARSTVDAAVRRGITPPTPSNVTDAPGLGVRGTVEGRDVAVGASAWLTTLFPAEHAAIAAARGAGLRGVVAVDGQIAGAIEYADQAREGLHGFFEQLRRMGLRHLVLLSGDHQANVEGIARAVGITDARGDLLPQQKVDAVKEMMHAGRRVVMVGDGTNDAPALSAATAGIALAAHGGGIAAEAADAVILCDDITRVADAIRFGRRAVAIARQSIFVGLGLSGLAMVAAAFGYFSPTTGAMLQEAIDVAVILNAVRASGE
ncbi:MAG: heavy metal translocating P-type ATPase [Gemmatimonadota bacterium]|nr:heavy metal translocating P-type ATPase [Gemmatimonadota bacterium]